MTVLLTIAQTNAADISIDRFIKSDNYYLKLEGEIQNGDFEKILNISSNKIISTIYLYSPGGNVQEAMKISEYLNENLITTTAPTIIQGLPELGINGFNTCKTKYGPKNITNCTCDSSCGYIWILASIRSGNVIRLHRPRFDYNDYSNMTVIDAKKSYDILINNLKNRFVESQINPQIIEIVMNTSSGSIKKLTDDELELVGKYAPFLEELFMAKCKDHIDELMQYNVLEEKHKLYDKILRDNCLPNSASLTNFCIKNTEEWDKSFYLMTKNEPKNYFKCRTSKLNELRISLQSK